MQDGEAALTSDSTTLYLHGLGLGEFFWRFQAVRGYDYAADQARAGQVSVVVDRLGYDSSDKPPGKQLCLGSQADIAHQMVLALRNGDYQLGEGMATSSFSKVVLAGHSYGGLIAQIEAYSFGDIDGLINMDPRSGRAHGAELAQPRHRGCPDQLRPPPSRTGRGVDRCAGTMGSWLRARRRRASSTTWSATRCGRCSGRPPRWARPAGTRWPPR